MPSWRFSNFKKVVFSNFKVGAIELIWKIPRILANRLNGPAYRYSTARPPIWPKANDQIPSSRARRPKPTAPHVTVGLPSPRQLLCWPAAAAPCAGLIFSCRSSWRSPPSLPPFRSPYSTSHCFSVCRSTATLSRSRRTKWPQRSSSCAHGSPSTSVAPAGQTTALWEGSEAAWHRSLLRRDDLAQTTPPQPTSGQAGTSPSSAWVPHASLSHRPLPVTIGPGRRHHSSLPDPRRHGGPVLVSFPTPLDP
jgi:hypothetical protein